MDYHLERLHRAPLTIVLIKPIIDSHGLSPVALSGTAILPGIHPRAYTRGPLLARAAVGIYLARTASRVPTKWVRRLTRLCRVRGATRAPSIKLVAASLRKFLTRILTSDYSWVYSL